MFTRNERFMPIVGRLSSGSSDARSAENQTLSIIHHVQGSFVEFHMANQIHVPVAGPTKGIRLAFYLNFGNFAAAVAFFFSASAHEGLLVNDFAAGQAGSDRKWPLS